ncbi:hypothetical protein [Desulfonatronovibrio magnus]|nr:hypothetical protein [Desulfonatronovibrio magnus]
MVASKAVASFFSVLYLKIYTLETGMIKDRIDRLISAHGGFRKLRSFVV